MTKFDKKKKDDSDQLNRYILEIIRTSGLINANKILFKIRESLEFANTISYQDIIEQLKFMKESGKIEPIVVNENRIGPLTYWRLKG